MTFGSYPLQHVSNVRVQETRVINERLIPGGRVGHRSDQTAGGRIVTVAGQIRNDPDYVLRLEELRVRADDIARSLDLEGGSSTINAKLGTIEAIMTVEDGVDQLGYSAGAFSHQVTGLAEDQTIYYRAKAHNSAGWGYDSEQSFQTYKGIKPTDSGSGSETSLSLSATVPLTDSGSGVEASVPISFTINESGTGADTATASMSVSDSATGAEGDLKAKLR